MWMMVMFDLPTETPFQRKHAAKFRNFLMDKGFSMAQYSVYIRFTGSREDSEKYVRAVKKAAPSTGDICILFFTDKQFGDIIKIENAHKGEMPVKPAQYQLFWNKKANFGALNESINIDFYF